MIVILDVVIHSKFIIVIPKLNASQEHCKDKESLYK